MGGNYTSLNIDKFFRSFLDIDGFSSNDNSMNGIQVDNDGGLISKIAFSVDSGMEVFERCAAAGAGMLFVHHGLFWSSSKQANPQLIKGIFRKRIKFLLDNNICLYAVHLPLDQHPQFGNNAVLAEKLGLENLEPFGVHNGKKVGYKGIFPKPITVEQAAAKIAFSNNKPLGVYPFGKAENTSCAVVSGGAAYDGKQAIEEGIDLFVTGEMSHGMYHDCLEGKLNMIAGGHYSTETWGVNAVMAHCANELNIDTLFIDVPTGQ